MFAPLRRMLHVEDDDLLGGIVHGVVDKIGVLACDELAHAFGLLKAADMRK
jgi:hypothetical protein